MEIWKNIEDNEGYEVSSLGRVRSLPNGGYGKSGKTKILKQEIEKRGYCRVHLGYKNRFSVHRLVAKAFIDEVEGKDYVNHIDNNPSNNNVDNLEWCTQSENMIHSHNQGRSPQAIKNMYMVAERKRAESIEKYKYMLGDRFVDMYSIPSKNGTRGKVKCKCICGKDIDTRTDSTIANRGFVCGKCI